MNTVFWDEWEIVPYFDFMYKHQLSVSQLFAQHNEHRIFFPRIIILGLGRLTSYNTVVLMYLSWGLLLASCVCLLLQHLAVHGRSLGSLVAFTPVPWLLFTLRQSDNLLWGWQIEIVLCVGAFVAASVLLRRKGRVSFAAAALCAIVSAYSLAAGLLAWPALLGLLLYQRWARHEQGQAAHSWAREIVWSITGALVWGLYLRGYVKPGAHPSLRFVLSHPLQGLYVFFATLGGSVSGDLRSADAAGALIVALWLVCVFAAKRRLVDLRRFAPAVPLILFSAGAAALITVGRSGFGAEGFANAVRYVTLTVLGLIGSYFAVLAISHHAVRHVLLGTVGGLVLFAVFASYDGAFAYGAWYRNDRKRGSEILRSFESRKPSDLKELYPSAEIVRERAVLLRKYGLNVFAGATH